MTSALTEEIKQELRTKHAGKDLRVLEADVDGETLSIVVAPNAGEFSAWRDARDLEDATPASKRLADHNFVNNVRVWPPGDEWLALSRERPALASTYCGQLAKIAGATASARQKKL